MIVTQKTPFSKEQIKQAAEQFGTYIKTVIDLEERTCSAGADRHFESEEVLLKQGSKQNDLWGGGVDLETKDIDGNSMINIRPAQNNRSNEIQDPQIREKFEELTKYFFQELYE
jgi:hypothetical protein